MQQLQHQRHHQVIKLQKSSNVNAMKMKSSQAQLKERLSNMRDGISKKARKVTERLSVVSLGKRGTSSGANNDRDKRNLNILKLFIILNPLMYTPMCFYLKEVKWWKCKAWTYTWYARFVRWRRTFRYSKKAKDMKKTKRSTTPNIWPSRSTVARHPPPPSSPPPSTTANNQTLNWCTCTQNCERIVRTLQGTLHGTLWA